MTTQTEEHTGGCLCGAVRYRATGEPMRVSHCHCGMCRKASGGPFLTCAQFPVKHFALTKGEPSRFKSSDIAVRGFCAHCGCQLTFQYVDDRETTWLTVGSADRPDALEPTNHIFTADQLPWLRLDDDLPRAPDAGDVGPAGKG